MLRRFRTSGFRSAVLALAAFALLAVPVTASAGSKIDKIDSAPAPLAVDVFFLRPMGLIALGVSAILYVPMAGITAITRPVLASR